MEIRVNILGKVAYKENESRSDFEKAELYPFGDGVYAVREILDPYIGEDGFIKECGLRKVHTEEHGDFCIILYHNPSEVMTLRAFYLNSKKK